jgi:hypothetical protein
LLISSAAVDLMMNNFDVLESTLKGDDNNNIDVEELNVTQVNFEDFLEDL